MFNNETFVENKESGVPEKATLLFDLASRKAYSNILEPEQ